MLTNDLLNDIDTFEGELKHDLTLQLSCISESLKLINLRLKQVGPNDPLRKFIYDDMNKHEIEEFGKSLKAFASEISTHTDEITTDIEEIYSNKGIQLSIDLNSKPTTPEVE